MFKKLIYTLLLSSFVHLYSFGQSDVSIKPISLVERALLDFILKDSVNDLNLNLLNENLSFGVPTKLTNGTSLLKKKDTIYLQLMGSGRLYQIQKQGNSIYDLIRLDSTFYAGSNFGCINLFYKDTLFQFGGTGFWNIKNHFTFFSKKTHEWEFFTTKQSLPVYQSFEKGIIYYTDQEKGKLYLSNSINRLEFPASLNTSLTDTCSVFDFKEKTWKHLGKINPRLKEIVEKSTDLKTIFGPYVVFHSDLEMYWLNFSTNQFGKLVKDKQAEFREKWLKIYKDRPKYMFQFVMGNHFYLIRIEDNGVLNYEAIDLSMNDFIDLNAQPIYSNSLIVSVLKKIEPGRPFIGNVFIVLLVLLIFSFYNKKIKKKKMPVEVQSILYKNFYSALTAIEKELILSIYQLQTNNEQISIKAINKIIGVQQKDTITQNKSRSDYFLRINQKFKLATRASELLVVKQREETDKRIYNYNINPIFIDSIKALILNNQ
jgi:hypothetical protein